MVGNLPCEHRTPSNLARIVPPARRISNSPGRVRRVAIGSMSVHGQELTGCAIDPCTHFRQYAGFGPRVNPVTERAVNFATYFIYDSVVSRTPGLRQLDCHAIRQYSLGIRRFRCPPQPEATPSPYHLMRLLVRDPHLRIFAMLILPRFVQPYEEGQMPAS